MARWSVLMLCTGHGNELLRGAVEEVVVGVGFEFSVYDGAEYPVDPLVHSHAACVRAIDQSDIVLAFLDDRRGGEFQSEKAPPEMHEALAQAGVLYTPSAPPSITQVEVLTARHLGKPTLLFVPTDVQTMVGTIVQQLRSGSIPVRPRAGVTTDPTPLIQGGNWEELHDQFVVPAAPLKSFGQVAFLERMRRETPNFVSYYDGRNLDDLRRMINGRLAGVVQALVRRHVTNVQHRIERHRSPLSILSLQDLYVRGLIVSPVTHTLSGPASDQPLFGGQAGEHGQNCSALLAGKNVLLLGEPGMGKTTTALFSFREAASSMEAGIQAIAPLYANWRELPPEVRTADDLVRYLLGWANHREPWPKALALPRLRWMFVLDGLDEGQYDPPMRMQTVRELSKEAVVLISSRRTLDYERSFHDINKCFNLIIELLPWGTAEVARFIAGLRSAGMEGGASLVERWQSEGAAPDLISLPLWLSMIAFLGERSAVLGSRKPPVCAPNEYELLRQCSDAVAEDEITRQKASISVESLRNLWAKGAWYIQQSRRERHRLSAEELATSLGIPLESPVGKSVFSFLDVSFGQVTGFFHEVFQEYWLAEHILDRLVSEPDCNKLPRLFQYQRSVVTNRLLRMGLRARSDLQELAERIRNAYWAAGLVEPSAQFVKNQLVYLLGRVDDSLPTREFLRTVWKSEGSAFVRYSAAFAAIMLGETTIEQEYYNLLQESPRDEDINRAYHLYYYGDVELRESEMPPHDDGCSAARQTLTRLAERLRLKEPRNTALRRVELFTVRRLLETGRSVPLGVDMEGPVREVLKEVEKQPFEEPFAASARAEAQAILALLALASRRPDDQPSPSDAAPINN